MAAFSKADTGAAHKLKRVFTTAQKVARNAYARARYRDHPEKRRIATCEEKERARINALNRRKSAPEKARAVRAAWRLKNPEKVKASGLRSAHKHIEKRRAYWTANSDKAKARVAAWRKANPKRFKAGREKWAADNPGKIRAIRVRRRLVKKGASIGDIRIIEAWESKWKRRKLIICYWCRNEVRTKDCHTDHIIPTSKGGAHSISNLCVSCAPCNKTKNAKTIEVWNRKIMEPVLF